MSFRMYFLKICYLFKISRNTKTLVRLFGNSIKFHIHYKLNLYSKKDQSAKFYELSIQERSIDLFMRTNKGDLAIFYEIFWKEIYKIPFLVLPEKSVILDLGAHIGCTAIYFSMIYPDAQIYAVEASEESYNILKENVKSFKNIIAVQAVIDSKDGVVCFDTSGYSFNSKINHNGKMVQSISISTLMMQYQITRVNLIKIDIEGAEKNILQNNVNWLKKTDNMIIELHDDYKLVDLSKDIAPFGFTLTIPSKTNGLLNIFAGRTLENQH